MIDLIETLIGMLFTLSIFYVKYFYGTRAMLALTAVFAIGSGLAVWLFTEIMKSVCEEEDDDDSVSDGLVSRYPNLDTARTLAAYHVLEISVSSFERIVKWCSKVLDIDEEGGDLDE